MYVPINDESEIRDAHDWDYWQTKRSHWTRHNIFFLYLDNNNILLSINSSSYSLFTNNI